MERLPINKRIHDWEIWVLEEKGWDGGENKDNLGWMKQTPLQGTENWSRECWNDRIHLKRSTPVGKELKWQPQWSRRTSTPIEIWEHRLGKVWNQHLTLKQLEYHNLKQNKGLACRISWNKHMIEILSKVFVVGPTRARSYNTIMYKAVHMTYEASPSRHIQGLFKTLRDHCKTNRGKADH